MNIANLITGGRFIFLPVLLWSFAQQTVGLTILAFILLILLMIGDFIDGYLAKRRGEVTKVGSFLDPLASKITVYGTLIILIVKTSFFLFPLLVFLARDIIVSIIRYYSTKYAIVRKKLIFRKFMIAFQYSLVLLLVLHQLLQNATVLTINAGAIFGVFAVLLMLLAVLSAVLSAAWETYQTIVGVRKSVVAGRDLKKQEFVILANKRSSGYRDSYRRRLLRTFAKRRHAKVHYLPKKQEMYQGSEKKIGTLENVMIAGGDGSFERALNYEPFHKKRLGFFPFGAGNAYYSYFYKGKRFHYLHSQFAFRSMSFDVLEVSWEKGSFQTGLFVAGMDAEVIRLSEKKKHGFIGYLKSSWQAFWKAKTDYEITCTIDGKKTTWSNCISVAIAKIPYYGYGIRGLPGEVPPSDGKVYGLAHVNTHFSFSNRFIRVWSLLLLQLGQTKPPVVPFSGKEITIESDVPLPIQAGGEFLGFSQKFTLKVVRQQEVLVL